MVAVRVAALIALGLLAAYQGLRLAASSCTGSGCDAHIPASLLLPFSTLVAVAVAGGLALSATRREAGARTWAAALATTTILGTAGTLAAVAIWRDSPDTLVPVATVLLLLGPLCALVFSFSRQGSSRG
jgi:hypothetical protein